MIVNLVICNHNHNAPVGFHACVVAGQTCCRPTKALLGLLTKGLLWIESLVWAGGL